MKKQKKIISKDSSVSKNTSKNKTSTNKEIVKGIDENALNYKAIDNHQEIEDNISIENISNEPKFSDDSFTDNAQENFYDIDNEVIEEPDFNDEISYKKNKNGLPPKKIKVNGVVYYRKLASFESNTALNEQDRIMLQQANQKKFRQPMSYRWLKILGLFALIVPFLLIRIMVSFPDMEENLFTIISDIANTLSLPLVIFAAFILILKSNKKANLLITYSILAIIIYVVLIFLFEHYLLVILSSIHPEMSAVEIREYANSLAAELKIFQYNIFVDLLMCSAFFYFTNETPKRLKDDKKKMQLFRLGALLPVIYIIASMILSGLANSGVIQLDNKIMGIMTCRSPATYLIFFAVSLFLSNSQKIYLRNGGTMQGFKEFKKTNAHSLQFSIVCSIIILVVCLLDFLFGLIPGSSAFGIGDSKLMFVIIPFIMLISYSKEYKSNTIDLFLPIITISAIIFLVVDTVFTVIFA